MNRRTFLTLLAGVPLVGPLLLDQTPVRTVPCVLLHPPRFTGWMQPVDRLCHESWWVCHISDETGKPLVGYSAMILSDVSRHNQPNAAALREYERCLIENGWHSLIDLLDQRGVPTAGLQMPRVLPHTFERA